MSEWINGDLERTHGALEVDTRRFSERAKAFFASEEAAAMTMVFFAIGVVFFKHLTEWVALLGFGFFFYIRHVQKQAGLAMRVPKSSGEIDPKEINPGTRKPMGAAGIVYMGNVEGTGEEVWLSDNQARTHMLFMGTTGSGKTEYLISLVYNALIHGSGLIYVDGKADSSLYGKVYSMARAMGREDDVLVINFQTGAKDIYGAQSSKLSNTLNPFAVGSSGMLSELVKGLMATGEKSTWTQQAESFVEALIKPLVYLRDYHGLNLDVNVIREFFELNKLEELMWRYPEKYPKLLESGALDGLKAYLLNKPGYKQDKYHDQAETTHEQHGFITMQLGRTFNSLSDTYGYIMKTPLAEIDFVDVFLNRRILVVLLPALEKSPSELTNLGRIVVASIKATMAKGLGSQIEGDWSKVIDSKPTTSPSPFMCVLDEYGYYAVEGFAVVPAQARSLGFSAIFAGQDLPAFEKASKEEAKSTLANTNTKFCGKLECVDTFKYFQSLGGQGLYTRVTRYETNPGSLNPLGGAKADNNVQVERMDRVNLEGLRGQLSGQWNMFYANTMLRVKGFYAAPKNVQQLRVNHFIKVARPDPDEVASFQKSTDTFMRAVKTDGGMKSFMDIAGSVADIKDMTDALKMFGRASPLLRAGMALAHCAQAEERRAQAFTALTARSYETEEIPEEALFDVAGQMAGETAWGAPSTPPWPGDAAVHTPSHEVTHAPVHGGALGGYGAVPMDEDYAAPEPEGLYDGVPSDVAGGAAVAPEGDEGYGQYKFDETVTDFPEPPLSVNDGVSYGDDFDIGDPPAAERQSFLPQVDEEARPPEHTSVFGMDEPEMPESVAFASNDVASTGADVPQELDSVEETFEDFDEPQADGGVLSREATHSGIEAIEQLAGATAEESRITASIVVEDLRDATQYAVSPPSAVPDLDKFADIAERVALLLSKRKED